MAGVVAPTEPILHRSRGVVRTEVTLLSDASGDASEDNVNAGFGRLVGVCLNTGTLEFGSAIITIKDQKTGATLLALDTLAYIASAHLFGSTTTGDTSGGAAEDLWTTGAVHGLVASDAIIFTSLTGNGAGGPTVGVKYYVVTGASLTTTTFVLSDTAAHAVAGTNIVNVGATDASAASWIKVGANTSVTRFFRPTQVIVDNVGVAITAATTANKVNRDIFVAGKISAVLAEGGATKTGTLVLIIDESNIGDLANTV